MADLYVGDFQILTTDSGNKNVTWTGGFQPSLIIAWWNNLNSGTDTDTRGDHQSGIGYGVSSTDTACYSSFSDDNVGTSDCHKYYDNGGSFIMTVDSSGTQDGLAALTASGGWPSTGFQINISNQFPADMRVFFVALGSDIISNATTGMFSNSSQTYPFTQDEAVGFDPDGSFFTPTYDEPTTFWDTNFTNYLWNIAFATETNNEIGAEHFYDDGASTMQSEGYCYNGEMSSSWSGDAPAMRLNYLGNVTTNNFRVNWVEGPTASYRSVIYCAYKLATGASHYLDVFNTRTDTNNIARTGYGGQPGLVMLLSCCEPNDTIDTSHAPAKLTIGAASGTGQQRAMATFSNDNEATSVLVRSIQWDGLYVRPKYTSGTIQTAYLNYTSTKTAGSWTNIANVATDDTNVATLDPPEGGSSEIEVDDAPGDYNGTSISQCSFKVIMQVQGSGSLKRAKYMVVNWRKSDTTLIHSYQTPNTSDTSEHTYTQTLGAPSGTANLTDTEWDNSYFEIIGDEAGGGPDDYYITCDYVELTVKYEDNTGGPGHDGVMKLVSFNTAGATFAMNTSETDNAANQVAVLAFIPADVSQDGEVTEVASVRVKAPSEVTDVASVRVKAPSEVTEAASIRTALQSEVTDAASVRTALRSEVTDAASVRLKASSETTDAASVRVALQSEITEVASLRAKAPSEVTEQASIRAKGSSEITEATSVRIVGLSEVTDSASIRAALQSEVTDVASVRTALQSEVTDVASIRAALQGEATDVASVRTALRSEVTDVASVRVEAPSEVTEVASVRTALQGEVTDVASVRTALRGEVTEAASIRVELAQLQSEVTEVASIRVLGSSEVTDAASIRTALLSEVTEVASVRTALQSEITDAASIRTKAPSEVTNAASVRTKLLGEITEAASLRVALQNEVTEVASIRTALQNEVTDVSSVRIEGSSEVTEAASIRVSITGQGEVTEVASIRTKMPSEVTEAASIRTALNGEVTEAASVRTALRGEVTDVASVRTALQSEVTSAASIRLALPSEVTEAASIRLSLQGEVTDVASVRTALQGDITEDTSIRIQGSSEVAENASIRVSITGLGEVTEAASIRVSGQSEVTDVASVRVALQGEATDVASIRISGRSEVTETASVRTALYSEVTDVSSVRVALQGESTEAASIRTQAPSQVTAAASIRVAEYLAVAEVYAEIDITPLVAETNMTIDPMVAGIPSVDGQLATEFIELNYEEGD